MCFKHVREIPKSDDKTFTTLEKIYISNTFCYEFSVFQIMKKEITFYAQNNLEMFLEQQTSILEWFLKDHVTMDHVK